MSSMSTLGADDVVHCGVHCGCVAPRWPQQRTRCEPLGLCSSLNENVSHFKGPSDHDFAMHLEQDAYMMKADAREFFD